MKEMKRQRNLPLVGENKEATLGIPPLKKKTHKVGFMHGARHVRGLPSGVL